MGDSAPVRAARPSAPAVPQRRAHREVIDVDELDDYPPSRRPRLQVHSSETRASTDIIVLDSDDGETGPPTRPRSTGGRLRSPPPPVQTIHAPPPVPSLPSRHRPRQQTRAFPPDVIRPNVEPFAFERTMVSPVPRPASHPPLGDASRPRPTISLGGGFVSLSNRREAELLQHQQARDQARQRYFDRLRIVRGIHQRHGFLSQTIGRIFPTWLFGDPTEEEMMDALAFSDLAAAEAGPFDLGDAQPRRVLHEYRVAYTHPYPPAPGFTHNFESPSPSVTVIDVDEEPGPSGKPAGLSLSNSSSENMNTLVCARCLDPLVLGGSSMSEDERTRRRLWGLRCGHMLDGKCIAELMKPQPTPDIEPTMEVTGTNSSDSKIQGEGLSAETHSAVTSQGLDLDDTVHLDTGLSARTTASGGKARTVEPQLEPSQLAMDDSEPATSADISTIRSRLRPRNIAGHVARASSSTSFSPSSQASHRTSGPVHPTPSMAAVASAASRSKRRPKGKGKQKVAEPLVLGRHEWRCPIALCERLHLSLNIEAQGWVMDETQGAISIFA